MIPRPVQELSNPQSVFTAWCPPAWHLDSRLTGTVPSALGAHFKCVPSFYNNCLNATCSAVGGCFPKYLAVSCSAVAVGVVIGVGLL